MNPGACSALQRSLRAARAAFNALAPLLEELLLAATSIEFFGFGAAGAGCPARLNEPIAAIEPARRRGRRGTDCRRRGKSAGPCDGAVRG